MLHPIIKQEHTETASKQDCAILQRWWRHFEWQPHGRQSSQKNMIMKWETPSHINQKTYIF